MFSKVLKMHALMFCLMVGQVHAGGAEKLVVLKRVNELTGQLIRIAQHRQALSRNGATPFDGAEVKRLIKQQSSLDVLVHLALASRDNRFPGRAEDQVVDNVMDEAWTRCITRIEEIGGNEAISALETIGALERLDGADSLHHRNALERLRVAGRRG